MKISSELRCLVESCEVGLIYKDQVERLPVRSLEIDDKDSRRTVDAIRAYDRSKDASRDADYDRLHGKAYVG